MCKKCSSGLTYRAGGLILPFKLLEGNGGTVRALHTIWSYKELGNFSQVIESF